MTGLMVWLGRTSFICAHTTNEESNWNFSAILIKLITTEYLNIQFKFAKYRYTFPQQITKS